MTATITSPQSDFPMWPDVAQRLRDVGASEDSMPGHLDHFTNYAGWTLHIRRDAPLYVWREAVRAVERDNPVAQGHLAHLRTMRDIAASSIAARAETAMWARFGVESTEYVDDPQNMPVHGPVECAPEDYADRADNYAALAQRMRERVARMRRITADGWCVEPDFGEPGTWRVVADDGRVLAVAFGSAVAAVEYMDDPFNGRIDWTR